MYLGLQVLKFEDCTVRSIILVMGFFSFEGFSWGPSLPRYYPTFSWATS